VWIYRVKHHALLEKRRRAMEDTDGGEGAHPWRDCLLSWLSVLAISGTEIVTAETTRGSLEERVTSDHGLLSPLPTDKPKRDRV